MRNIIRLPVIFIFSFFCLCASFRVAPAAQGLFPAPEFSLQDLARQKSYSLNDYRGKQALIIFFWTTWCPFCRSEIRALNKKYEGLQSAGIEVLAINTGEERATVERFMRGQAFNFNLLLDIDSKVADAYDVMGVPTYIFVNKEGLVVFKDHYFPEDSYKELLLE